jgi:23S rRNA (guanosine2251-2'-O)-methyltransferase
MLKTRRIILVLNNIRSIHNVGSILRTAEALGLKDIVYSGYTPYPEIPEDTRIMHIRNKIAKTINKTSLDAEFNLNHQVIDNLREYIKTMKNKGYVICSLEQDQKSTDIKNFDNTSDIVLILGNEVSGVDKDILELSDFILEIPQKGKKESLNVVQATAIALYILTN